MQTFIREGVAQRTRERRIRRTLVDEVVEVVRLEIDIARDEITILVDERRNTMVVKTLEVHREERTVGIALRGETRASDHVDQAVLRLQIRNLRLGMREDKVGAPLEVLGDDIARRNRDLLTIRAHRGNIGVLHDGTALTRGDLRTNQVVVVTEIVSQLHIQAVVEETEVETEVELVLLLISQIRVG